MSRPHPKTHQNECSTAELSLFAAISRPAQLLPGEDLRDYEAMRDMLISEITPRSGIEWLWTMDLVELSWDILRYRQLRQKVLEQYRQQAIASALRGLDGSGIAAELHQLIEHHTKRNAAEWRQNPQAAVEIENRLKLVGIDDAAINMEVFVQAQNVFMMFDALMQSAQSRRVMLLREINCRRAVALRILGVDGTHPRQRQTMLSPRGSP